MTGKTLVNVKKEGEKTNKKTVIEKEIIKTLVVTENVKKEGEETNTVKPR